MRIDRIKLENIDPLRMFTHDSIFEEKHDEEQEEDPEEKKRKNDEKIQALWNSLTKAPKYQKYTSNILDFLNLGPKLADIAKLLNRSDVQDLIKEKLIEEFHEDPSKRKESRVIRKNLEIFNGRIARENKVWFRRIPLFSRVFWQIDKVNIPKIK
ncbi:hypothetical protein N9Y92_00735 [Chlamydiales bacterium]|nr:hypothetical protein [Chlamydiales bacterium]